MQLKFEVPKMKQSEIAYQLGYSSTTIKRHRGDINMLSRYRKQSNTTNKRSKNISNTNFDNISYWEHEHKRDQRSSNDPKVTSKNDHKDFSKKVKSKKFLKGGDSS